MVAAIRAAAPRPAGRIDDDHYGAAFTFRFGAPDDPGMKHAMESYRSAPGATRSATSRWRRDDDPRSHRQLCRGRRVEVHPAPGGVRR